MPGVDQLVLAMRGERRLELVAAVGGEAEPEARDRRGVDPALGEVAPRLAAIDPLQAARRTSPAPPP